MVRPDTMSGVTSLAYSVTPASTITILVIVNHSLQPPPQLSIVEWVPRVLDSSDYQALNLCLTLPVGKRQEALILLPEWPARPSPEPPWPKARKMRYMRYKHYPRPLWSVGKS